MAVADRGVEDGLLVLRAGVLLAVLVRLEAPFCENDRGGWHLEVGFGRCAARPAAFASLEDTLRWIADSMGEQPHAAVTPALHQFGADA